MRSTGRLRARGPNPGPKLRAQCAVQVGRRVPRQVAIASDRVETPSLAKIRLMWFLTVFSSMNSAPARQDLT